MYIYIYIHTHTSGQVLLIAVIAMVMGAVPRSAAHYFMETG